MHACTLTHIMDTHLCTYMRTHLCTYMHTLTRMHAHAHTLHAHSLAPAHTFMGMHTH